MNNSNNQISHIQLPIFIKTVPIGKVLHKQLLNFFFANFSLALLITVLLTKKLKNKQKNMNVQHVFMRLYD